MISLKDTFTLDENTKVDRALVEELEKYNFSKIPVYRNSKTNVYGYINVKNLLKLNIEDAKTIKQGDIVSEGVKVQGSSNLLNAVDSLRNNKSNFAIIVGEGSECLGIITLRQIFEKITLKKFNDDDVRTNFHWNRPDKIAEVHEGREQD